MIQGQGLCGFVIKVLQPNCELRNEVKRIGFFSDRESELDVRVGDTLVLYISTTVA